MKMSRGARIAVHHSPGWLTIRVRLRLIDSGIRLNWVVWSTKSLSKPALFCVRTVPGTEVSSDSRYVFQDAGIGPLFPPISVQHDIIASLEHT